MTIINESDAQAQKPIFGNGHSLKYFNFVHFVFTPVTIFYALSNLKSIIDTLGNKLWAESDSPYAFVVPVLLVVFFLANLVLDGLVITNIIKKDPWKFSFCLLIRYPFGLAGTIITTLLMSSIFPALSRSATAALVMSVFAFVLTFVPNYIYFKKRMTLVKSTVD